MNSVFVCVPGKNLLNKLVWSGLGVIALISIRGQAEEQFVCSGKMTETKLEAVESAPYAGNFLSEKLDEESGVASEGSKVVSSVTIATTRSTFPIALEVYEGTSKEVPLSLSSTDFQVQGYTQGAPVLLVDNPDQNVSADYKITFNLKPDPYVQTQFRVSSQLAIRTTVKEAGESRVDANKEAAVVQKKSQEIVYYGPTFEIRADREQSLLIEGTAKNVSIGTEVVDASYVIDCQRSNYIVQPDRLLNIEYQGDK